MIKTPYLSKDLNIFKNILCQILKKVMNSLIKKIELKDSDIKDSDISSLYIYFKNST